MTKLLVNAPSGAQELIDVGDGGGYFDPARVLWDERMDGAMPVITLGGMVRSGLALVFSQARMEQHIAASRPVVPAAVPMAAARKVLRAQGIKDADVRTAIANSTMTAAQKEDALIDWEFEANVHRASSLVLALGPVLGLTSAQMDALFIAAGAPA
jgi:hypothetical protein